MTTTMVIMTMMKTWQWRKELVVGQEPLHSPFTITLRTLAALIKKLPGQKCFSYLPGSDGNLTLSPSSESNESSESREFCENAESPTAPPPFPTSPMNQANRTASQRLFCCYLCCCCCGAGETFYWILDASSCAPWPMAHAPWIMDHTHARAAPLLLTN